VATSTIYSFDGYSLDTSSFELRYHAQLCPLARRPLDLLHYLVVHRDRVVSKEELIANVWQSVHVTANAMVQAVALVREALEHTDQARIVSVRGRGYRFVGTVVERKGGRGGVVVDAGRVAEIEQTLGAIESAGVTLVRARARATAPLASFRALLAAHPDVSTAALASTASDAELTEIVLHLAATPSGRGLAFWLDGLEDADIPSLLLFRFLAAEPREGLQIVGTCDIQALPRGGAVEQLLGILAPHRRRAA
jgi:DNA-binding winged helix-turn-helix (wHTH) protein